MKSRKVIPAPPSPDLSTVRTALTPCDLLPTPQGIQGAKGTKGTAQPTCTKSQPVPKHMSRSCPSHQVTELNIYPMFIHFGSQKSHSLRILSSGQWKESQGSVYSCTLIRVMNVSHKQKHFLKSLFFAQLMSLLNKTWFHQYSDYEEKTPISSKVKYHQRTWHPGLYSECGLKGYEENYMAMGKKTTWIRPSLLATGPNPLSCTASKDGPTELLLLNLSTAVLDLPDSGHSHLPAVL